MRISANFWWRDDGPNLAIRLFSKIPRLSQVKTLEVDDASMWNVFVGVSIRSNTVGEISFQRLDSRARSSNCILGGVENRINHSE